MGLKGLSPRLIRTTALVIVALVAIIGALLTWQIISSKKEIPINDVRLETIYFVQQAIEEYYNRNGVYPQPSVKEEIREGVKHVWGYRPYEPALASCTVKLNGEGNIDVLASACGGDVYDIEGNVIGWKGTISIESSQNSVENALLGETLTRSPLSTIGINSLPADPSYLSSPELYQQGFGEFVYAIRNPKSPDFNNRHEYQLAGTVTDPETGSSKTLILGNYYTRSNEKDILPETLIGPGLVFDKHNNPIPDQIKPLHILQDNQQEGYPNPVLGDGENILLLLGLQHAVALLENAINYRIVILSGIDGKDASDAFETLKTLQKSVQDLQEIVSNESDNSRALSNLEQVEQETRSIANTLVETMENFVQERADHISDVLTHESQNQETIVKTLQSALEKSFSAEEEILVARDEILNYLDGKGIEEQIRGRVVRKLEKVLSDIPILSTLYTDNNCPSYSVFTSKKTQSNLSTLAQDEYTFNEPKTYGSGETIPFKNLSPVVSAITIAEEIATHFEELHSITSTILELAQNIGTDLQEIDDKLIKLSMSLASEHKRIEKLINTIAPPETITATLTTFQSAKENYAALAIAALANHLSEEGDFSPLLFPAGIPHTTPTEVRSGIPDINMYEYAYEATYQGIPYPLAQ